MPKTSKTSKSKKPPQAPKAPINALLKAPRKCKAALTAAKPENARGCAKVQILAGPAGIGPAITNENPRARADYGATLQLARGAQNIPIKTPEGVAIKAALQPLPSVGVTRALTVRISPFTKKYTVLEVCTKDGQMTLRYGVTEFQTQSAAQAAIERANGTDMEFTEGVIY